MRVCDLTMAYSATSGGIRTYIDRKRRFLLEETDREHVLIIPGEEDATEHEGRAQTRWIKSPPSGHGTYRLLWRPDKVFDALEEAEPDVIELGTFFVCPWPAFRYSARRREQGRPCPVVGYFHTDLANAYIQTPVEHGVTDWVSSVSDTLAELGVKLAEAMGAGAEKYFGSIFERCDAMLAASQGQADRLSDYGIHDPHIIPLGVDTETFDPSRRLAQTRADLGVPDKAPLFAYAGRMDEEKHVETLVDAFELIRRELPDAHLVLIGDGPLLEPVRERGGSIGNLHALGYIADKDRVAELLAAADVYLTAGPHETFGLSVIEAQASGLPIVGVEAGALPERVVEGTGLLCSVDDPQAMARAAREALDQRDAMGAAAREHAIANFGWSASLGRLLRLYERLLSSPSRAK